MTLTALIAVYLVQLAAAISPGPAILLAARTGLQRGFTAGAWLSVGVGLGACFWAVAALFGLSILFQLAPALLSVMKIVGALYLLWFAWNIWRHAPDPVVADPEGAEGPVTALSMLRLGLVTQLMNPKPALFFGTVFLTFVPPDAPAWAYAAILAMVFINDTGCAMLVSRVFSFERTRRAYLGLKTVFERLFGGLMALLGLKLALT